MFEKSIVVVSFQQNANRSDINKGKEMCYELIDRIIIGGSQSVIGMEREIEIVYKIDILGKASTRILLILAKNKKIT